MISCEIKVNKNKRIKGVEERLPLALEQVLKEGQQMALKNKRGNKDESLIQYAITSSSKEKVEGRIYTNFDYAPFLEYGTGNKSDGTMPHIGQTKYFKESGMSWWLLPKEKADATGKDFSHFRVVYSNKTQSYYYLMTSTQAYPFMRPTAFELETRAVEILKNELMK